MSAIVSKTLRLVVVTVIPLVVTQAAQAMHLDIRPHLVDGKIVTGTAELDGVTVIPRSDSARVFGAEFGEDDPSQPFFTEDPGFLAEAGAFPGGAGRYLGFDAPAGLRYWTGSGFGSVPADESLQVTMGSRTANIASAAASGFLFGTISSDGGLHEHMSFELLGSDGNPIPGDGVEPTAGVYLLEMTLRTTMSGVSPSLSFWVVYNSGGEAFEEAHEAAVAWAETYLVPEPVTAIFLLAGAGWTMRRKRRPV